MCEQPYTISEVASILEVCRETVAEWIKSGILKAYQLPPARRLWYIYQEDLTYFMKAHGVYHFYFIKRFEEVRKKRKLPKGN